MQAVTNEAGFEAFIPLEFVFGLRFNFIAAILKLSRRAGFSY
jgi:hypothetical protein